MHPLLSATTAAEYEYRAAVGLGRHGHRSGASLAATIENEPRVANVHWTAETTTGGEQLDRQRVTEDAAEAVTLALVHVACGWVVRRRLQRGERADWLLVDSDRQHVALEVSGTDQADDGRRLRDKLQQVSQVTSAHLGSGEPARQSPLHQDYLQLFAALVTADPKRAAAAAHEPPEYQAWRKMRDVPLESLRRLMIRARAGFDDAPESSTRA